MSDSLRQDPSDKLKSSVKPDSEKSVLEKGSDSAKSTADSVAGSVQPEGEKSMGQKATDTVSGGSGDAKEGGQSMLGSAQDTLGSTVKSVQDSLGMGEKK